MTISAIITLSIFVLTHIIATVFWAATIQTTLKIVVKDVSELVIELKAMKSLYVTKEEFSKAVAAGEKERSGIWDHIDEIRKRLNNN